MPLGNLPLHPDRVRMLGQLVRFGVSGGLLTLGVALVYVVLADRMGMNPYLALSIDYLVFTGIGYVTHSRWSFKDHGSRDNQSIRTARFIAVNFIAYLSNQFFVWLLVHQLGGQTWWPVIPIIFVTPLLTFYLNRQWVFS